MVVWEPSLVSEFKRLESEPSPHQRGLQLEKLLERLFQKAHFLVQRNAGAAGPRQTDLVAGYDNTWYIIEAKWEQHPVGTNVVDDVRIRVEGAGQGSIGVIIGVAGFNDAAVERVIQYRDRQAVLLIGEEELLQTLQSPELLANLLKKKRDQLVAHGRVHLGSDTTRKTRRRSTDDLPESSFSLLNGDQAPLPYLAAKDGFAELVFVHELPDVDWVVAGGSGVTLDLPVRRLNERGLIDLIHTLNSMGWTSSEPTWSIRQATTAWHGSGAREFVQALSSRKQRYDGLEEPHHTEQVTYFDTCPGGGFYTLTADVSSDPSRVVLRCNVSFQLVGVPVDMAPLRQLFERYDAMATGFFRPLAGPAVQRGHLENHQILDAVAYVVSADPFPAGSSEAEAGSATTSQVVEPEKWVTGIVARNPYHRPERGTTPEGWPRAVDSSEFIICALRNHHPLTKKPKGYFLISWELARTSDAQAFRPVADW
ncbi:restriction endonuclease [Streptomyces lydicus]|uniref:restriction endonuclease n=1 Tax=Streptomyces lydicus TaxID=47763 RepID=UPI00343052D0